jgi:hypothetical protein
MNRAEVNLGSLDQALPTGFSPGNLAFQELNEKYYKDLSDHLDRVDPKRQPNTALECVDLIADFASSHHPGRFCDGRVENIAWEIGRQLGTYRRSGRTRDESSPANAAGRWKILHVVTTVFGNIGPPRTIRNWIQRDPDSYHSVVVTRQGSVPMPSWFGQETLGERGGLVLLPPDASPLEKAAYLRETGEEHDLVVLHSSPSDVVPIVAFASENGPPVALANQADHCYWLGGTIADTILNLREVGRVLSVRRRFPKHNTLLPIPLSDSTQHTNRAEARNVLGIPESQVMLLSVGRAPKYIPTRTHDFCSTVTKILEQTPSAHLYLLGTSEQDLAKWYKVPPRHDRLHFLGFVEDPSLYQLAADVYLEGFPFGSQTALLESALPGVPPVLAFAPPSPLLVTNDVALEDWVTTPGSEQEYLDDANRLVQQANKRSELGRAVGNSIARHHIGDRWSESLQSFYSQAKQLTHSPRSIPGSDARTTDTDLAISWWHGVKYDDGHQTAAYVTNLGNALCGKAHWVKDWGEYKGARSLFRLGARISGSNAELKRRLLGTVIASLRSKMRGQWA